MEKISSKRTLNLENCEKVVGNCEKVAISDEMKTKWDEILRVFDTPDETADNPAIITEATIPKEQHGKQSRSDYHKDWAKNKAQISFRIDTDLKAQIDQHTKNRKEKLSRFVIRAIEEQIKRDNAE